ncbi:hypothetical protein FCM35_KLT02509 [Carex littledalei]|uniref:Uncharacterized protein n=1 Tax=Carex littledalei TaxID=544730 RepID=A0A833R7H5_9POAL|nr:hypothetical protein FCM35_KLT02509 [Carex littledalei]
MEEGGGAKEAQPGDFSPDKNATPHISWADISEEEDRANEAENQAVPISPFKEDYLRKHIPSNPEPTNPCQRPWIFSGPNPKPHGTVPTTNVTIYPPPTGNPNQTPPNPNLHHPNPLPAANPIPSQYQQPPSAANPNPILSQPNPKPSQPNPVPNHPNPLSLNPNPNPNQPNPQGSNPKPPTLNPNSPSFHPKSSSTNPNPHPINHPASPLSPTADQPVSIRGNKKRKGKVAVSTQGQGSNEKPSNQRHSARLSGKRPQTRFFVKNSKAKPAVGSSTKKHISEKLESAGIAAALEAEQLSQVPLTQQLSHRVDYYCGIGVPLVADGEAGSEPTTVNQEGPGLDDIPHEIDQDSPYVLVPTESQGENITELYEESLLPSIESEPEELSAGESSDG